MFESVAPSPPDPILGLSEAFNADTRENKINLTIGVYKDDSGATPILGCVKKAEARLLEDEKTKGYLGIDGLGTFCGLARQLTLGDLVDESRVAAFQTPGGTGALRIASDFLAKSFPGVRIWQSTPTWPNHPAIFETAGLNVQSYPYLAADGQSLDFASMMDAIEQNAKVGDIICLHACCHNPTGVDPTPEQWSEIAELTAQRGMLPLVDFAYHGFGLGLEEDRSALTELSKQHEEFLVCSSYSKNFGLYGERIGGLFAVTADASATPNVRSSIKKTIRSNYSNPPRHGGSIVACILDDPELTSEWKSELAQMRERIHRLRSDFVTAAANHGASKDFSFLMQQKGMFSFSGLTPMQVDWLRTEKGIYIVGSGRINVAGVTASNLDYLAQSIAEALAV
ncbi:MAG: aromatic amino acid transaminase [Aureliella sp.]